MVLLGLLVAVAVVVRLQTRHGTIVLDNVPPDAVVEIDGERITVNPAEGEPLQFEAAAGKHVLVVRRGDLALFAQNVTIEVGKQWKHAFTARLEPPIVKEPEKKEPTAIKAPPPTVSARATDRSQFTIVSGAWNRQGDELVQVEASQSSSVIMFGDDQWTDYDCTIDAMRVAGTASFSLLFRSAGMADGLEYGVAQEGNAVCNAVARLKGNTEIVRSYNFSLQNHTWYTARVHVRGSHVICSIYDNSNATETRVFDFFDARFPRGKVGLRTLGTAYRFKNIKVTAPDGTVLWNGPPAVDSRSASVIAPATGRPKPPLMSADGFVQLFNGVDLSGWKTHPAQPGNWHVENGMLVGSGPSAISHLYSIRDDYKDFHLRAQVRIGEAGNGGVSFRSRFGPSWPEDDRRYPKCYVAQIYCEPADANLTGILFVARDRGPHVAISTLAVRPFEWCTLEVIARGNHLVIKVNDTTTADYTDTKRLFSTGHIALQQNGPSTVVEFRKIELNEFGPVSTSAAGAGDSPASKKMARQATAAKPGGRRGVIDPPDDAIEFRGKSYKAFAQQLSWHQAGARCRELGGHLAVAKSDEENRFLISLIKRRGVDVVWLGATDEHVEGKWMWVDGTPMRYSNWSPVGHQPNNKQGVEHYLIMMLSQGGKWSDQPDNSIEASPGFVCQWD